MHPSPGAGTSTPWRVERVDVPAEGPAPWQILGAQQAGQETSLEQWGFDDWAWGVPELLTYTRAREYERFDLLVALAPGAESGPDAVVGAVFVDLPLVDNTSLVGVNLWVRPGARGQGCEEALLAAAEAFAADEGRTTIILETEHRPLAPGAAVLEPKSGVGVLPRDDDAARFALASGFELEQVERISTFHFPADDGAPTGTGDQNAAAQTARLAASRTDAAHAAPRDEDAPAQAARLAAMHADAAAHAGPEYVLHDWEGATPERWLDSLAVLLGRMSTDAPMAGLDIEPEVWDAGRVRTRDADRVGKGRGSLTVVAEHVPSGELAAFTEVEWPLTKPHLAFQHDTLVAATHRGRRLGLLIKTAQLLTLPGLRPELRRLHTWNAAENRHMLGINEAVGFTVTGSSGEWQRPLRRP